LIELYEAIQPLKNLSDQDIENKLCIIFEIDFKVYSENSTAQVEALAQADALERAQAEEAQALARAQAEAAQAQALARAQAEAAQAQALARVKLAWSFPSIEAPGGALAELMARVNTDAARAKAAGEAPGRALSELMAKLDAAGAEAARAEAARVARVEAARVEAARVEAKRVEAEQAEAARAEAAAIIFSNISKESIVKGNLSEDKIKEFCKSCFSEDDIKKLCNNDLPHGWDMENITQLMLWQARCQPRPRDRMQELADASVDSSTLCRETSTGGTLMAGTLAALAASIVLFSK